MNQSPKQPDDIPLCVDLDRTFFKSDLTWEMLNAFLLKHPLKIYLVVWWLIQGRHIFISKLAEYGLINIDLCPINAPVLEMVIKVKDRRRVHLISESSEKLLNKCEVLEKTFDCISGSDDERYQTGRAKSEFLVRKYGEKGFDYVGSRLVTAISGSMPELPTQLEIIICDGPKGMDWNCIL